RPRILSIYIFCYFHDPASTEIYTLSLHDALPIYFEQAVYDSQGITRTVKANGGSGNIPKTIEGLRIRKLTPLEYWRLQGFTDEQFYKAKDSGVSNSQLYKQSGNSVTVNVVDAIVKELK